MDLKSLGWKFLSKETFGDGNQKEIKIHIIFILFLLFFFWFEFNLKYVFVRKNIDSSEKV